MRYIPQLDALRAIAIVLVLLQHWGPENFFILPLGWMGVTLFFTLSGFLITNILLDSKVQVERKLNDRKNIIKVFFIRRSLRIFPIYYLLLLTYILFDVSSVKQNILWFLFYLSNLFIFNIQNWEEGVLHLWSLAVEEQFYLIWPFVILFIPKKYIHFTLWAFIIVAPIFRLIIWLFISKSFIGVLTPSCFDALGFGGLVSYYLRKGYSFSKINFLLIISVSIFVSTFFMPPIFEIVVGSFFYSLCSAIIIAAISINKWDKFTQLLNNRAAIFIGKISYGMYLYHIMIGYFYRHSLHEWAAKNDIRLPILNVLIFPDHYLIRFFIFFPFLIFLSYLSFRYIESPINSLKDRFPYKNV